MNYIIFGELGVICTHLQKLLSKKVLKGKDKIYALDIVMSGEVWKRRTWEHAPFISLTKEGIFFLHWKKKYN